MRKWLYALSLIMIASLLSVTYYVAGVRAEKELYAFIDSANHLSNLTISADNYQRGWLKSTVHIRAILHRPEQQDVSFSFNTAIYHGPIIIAHHNLVFGLGYARAEVPLPDEALSQFNTLFAHNSSQPILIVSFLLKYNTHASITLGLPPFELFAKEGNAEMHWMGLMSDWQVSPQLSHITGNLVFNGALFKEGDVNGNIGPLNLTYDIDNKDNKRLSGKAVLNFKSLQIQSGDQLPLDIDGFQISSKHYFEDNSMNASLKLDVSRVTFQGIDYGPGTLNLALQNVDAIAFNQIQQVLKTAGSSDLGEAQQQMVWLSLLPELPKLFRQGTVFEVKQFQLSMPQGLIFATAKITAPQKINENAENLLQFLNSIQAITHLEVPVAWLQDTVTDFLKFKIQQHQMMLEQIIAHAETTGKNLSRSKLEDKLLSEDEMNLQAQQQAIAQLDRWVLKGWLIKKDNVYSTKITFQQGALAVNDKSLNGSTQ